MLNSEAHCSNANHPCRVVVAEDQSRCPGIILLLLLAANAAAVAAATAAAAADRSSWRIEYLEAVFETRGNGDGAAWRRAL